MTETAPIPTGATKVTGSTGDAVARPADEPSIGELLHRATEDVSTLVRSEIALAKSELKVSMRFGGMAAALFGAAAFLLLLAVIMLSVAFAYFLRMTGLDLAWCFSLVFLTYVLVAGILGFVGYQKARRVRPPERAIAQAQETVDVLTDRG